jgi:hypothetical protein
MTDLTMRLAVPEDTERICRLLAQTFPNNPKSDSDIFDWQYWANPFLSPRIWLGEIDGEIVGCIAGYGAPVKIGERFDVAFIAGDAATAEQYRAQGVYTRIAEESQIAAKDFGPFSIGFTASATRIPRVSDAPRASFDLFVRPIVPVRRRKRAVEIGGPPDDVDILWSEVGRRFENVIVKDARWWSWRYAARPRSSYRYFEVRDRSRLTGLAVVEQRASHRRVPYILDLLAKDRRSARALVAIAGSVFEGARAVAFRCTPTREMRKLARSAGLFRVPHRFDSTPPNAAIFPHSEAARPLSTLPWSLTWGDMDHL